ncbi:MAG: alpha/beta fold hydrolase [Spirulinaceae cyanobacterium SM2_1_0]|nr:alpha/beta fold hydrolase [Spirulinaceae cyanobacterium SM2_1_0]
MTDGMVAAPPYQPLWFLQDGLVQTLWSVTRYGWGWQRWGDRASWLISLPKIPWQEQIFRGAEDVPLWGQWSCPPQAKGTAIITYGITGSSETAWYAHTLARKAYACGWAVLIYDWRGHGRSAALSPTPSSDGWREGDDQRRLAAQLVELGCPPWVALLGFSLGGQLALWGLHAAQVADDPLIRTAAVLCPALESNRSLDHLVSTPIGRWIEQRLTQELRAEAARRRDRFPDSVPAGAVERIDNIRAFDHEMVIRFYGFASVTDYYERTSPLYQLAALARPHLIIYAADDPMFAPCLVPELRDRAAQNPQTQLLLTAHGGHIAHLTTATASEDQFWGLNRLLQFCDRQRALA